MGGKARNIFQVVLGVAAIWATAGGASPWVIGALSTASLAYGAWSARDARKKALDAQSAALMDRRQMLRGATVAKSFVYGSAWMSGVITFWRPPKSKEDPYAWLVLAFPIAHKIRDFPEIYFGEERITPLDAAGEPVSGYFSRVVQDTATITGTIPENGIITVPTVGSEFMILGPLAGRSITVAIISPINTGDTGNTTDADGVLLNSTQVRIDGGLPGNQFTLTYSYQYKRKHIKIWKYLGTADQTANADLIAATAGEVGDNRWTETDRLQGIPYLIIRMLVDPDVFPKDLENISALVEGKDDVVDPRTGAPNFHKNSMMVARDYMLETFDVEASDFDSSLMNSEVNVCEEIITQPDPNTGAPIAMYRYLANCVLSTEVAPINNLGVILSSCDGSAVQVGASIDLRCGHYETPTITIDDDDFVTAPQITKGPDRMELYNGIRARYLNADKPFHPMEDCPAYVSEFYKNQDGGFERLREFDFSATTSAVAAQRIAKQMLHKERAGLTMSASISARGIQLSPEKTVYVNCRAVGFVNKPFRIKSVRCDASINKVDITLKEDGPLLYDWTFDEAAGIDPAPNSSLPNPRDVPLIDGLGADVGESAAIIGLDGDISPMCRIFWSPITDLFVLSSGGIELRYKRTSDRDWLETIKIPPTREEHRFPIKRGDRLIIQARLYNSLVSGRWSELVRTTDDTPAPYLASYNILLGAAFNQYFTVGGVDYIRYWSLRANAMDGNGDYLANFLRTDVADINFEEFFNSVILPMRRESLNPPSPRTPYPGAWVELQSQAFPVDEGKNYFASCERRDPQDDLAAVRAVTPLTATIIWRGNFGVEISRTTGAEVRRTRAGETWTQAKVFGKAPPGAESAVVLFRTTFKTFSLDGSISCARIRKPMFGRAAEGQISIPPWRIN